MTVAYVAFAGLDRIASGDLEKVLGSAKAYIDGGGQGLLLFDEGGNQVDFDLRGSLAEVLARVRPPVEARGPGRPRLGVKSGEVTLLPRHWEWLETQGAKASGTLRRLVDEARQQPVDATRPQIDAAFRIMNVLGGDLPGFEEASRALYKRNWPRFRRLIGGWPGDLGRHLVDRLEAALPALPKGGDHGPSWAASALAVARGIARGDRSALATIEFFLDRVAAVNPVVNALTAVWGEEARSSARAVDAALEGGEVLGPLAGLPFVVKGNLDVAGHPTDQGIAALAGAMAAADSPLVARLRAAGAIPIGHSNLPDLSLRFETDSSLHGRTVNPWNPERSPGGSSGGTGVALATGMAPLGLGNDAGGSIRLPALFGGLASLKPSTGRFPADHRMGGRDPGLASQLIPVDSVMARSVADLDALYGILAGTDPRDPQALPLPLRGPVPARPLRIALVVDPAGAGIHPGVAGALQAAAAALEAAGYRIEPATLPRFDEVLDAYDRMIQAEFALVAEPLERLVGAGAKRYLGFLRQSTQATNLGDYVGLTSLRLGLLREWTVFFSERPLVLGAVFTRPSAAIDEDIADAASHARIGRARALCSASSFLGLPAVSLTSCLVEGLPCGVQLVGAPFREDLCLEAALVLEGRFGTFGPIDPRPRS